MTVNVSMEPYVTINQVFAIVLQVGLGNCKNYNIHLLHLIVVNLINVNVFVHVFFFFVCFTLFYFVLL